MFQNYTKIFVSQIIIFLLQFNLSIPERVHEHCEDSLLTLSDVPHGESVLSINRLDDDDQVANTCTMYSINSTAPYAFGNYGEMDICPCGHAAVAYNLQIDEYHGSGPGQDDMFISGIKFLCTDDTTQVSSATSNQIPWNSKGWTSCPDETYPIGIQVFYEEILSNNAEDLGSTAGVRLICSDGRHENNYASFMTGRWPLIKLAAQVCRSGYALVGLRTQVDDFSRDKTGLNNVIIYCEREASRRCT